MKKRNPYAGLLAWYRKHRDDIYGRGGVHAKTVAAKVAHRKLSTKAVALAGHFVGVKEYPAGSNLQVFGKWYGENGVPWCAIFVSYVLSHIGRPFKYAYVPAIVADARAKKNGLSVIPVPKVNATLAAGFPVLACYDWTHDGTADHVEFAVKVSGGNVAAIGGNTGPSDWSNGGEVAREVRALDLVQAFVKVG